MTHEPHWNFENSYTQLPEKFYTEIHPTPVESPEVVLYNDTLAERLGLKSKAEASIFAGNDIPEGAFPLSQAYAGHQFGHFTMLGDGRAVLLGEQITPNGERFDIQLKGSGRTPYSRGGDGRATLGPMLREYMISEAIYHLGIPTTRSLAVTQTGESVMRETELPGAILTRVASSHLRFGTFQFAAKWGSVDEIKALADYAIDRHYPDCKNDKNRYLSFFEKVMKRHASLIAQWQQVGFIHGVMNTDNMTISGETIDYGPCAFMDTYNPRTVFSSIDIQGRYAYENQPDIGGWNLARFAETLLPLIHEDPDEAVELGQSILSGYKELYQKNWLTGMRAKLGLFNEKEEDEALVRDLLDSMEKYEADYTNTFRALTIDKLEGMVLFETAEFAEWMEKWKKRLDEQEETWDASQTLMKKSNPAIIPRNHRVEEALEAAVEHGDFSVVKRLNQVLANPYAYSKEQEDYTKLPKPSSTPYRTFCGT